VVIGVGKEEGIRADIWIWGIVEGDNLKEMKKTKLDLEKRIET
jgi:hypothetical protein